MGGTITLVPVYGDCSGELGKQHTWTISIERGVQPDALDLSQISPSGPWFIGTATKEAAKPS
jgi:hypothetical protein